MILTCPACGTQYSVSDNAIPAGGRNVRCASCGHSWHQQPAEMESIDGQPADQATADPAPDEPMAPPSETDDAEWSDAIEPAVSEGESDLAESPAAVPVPPPNGWPVGGSQEAEFDPDKEIPDAEEIAAVRSESSQDRKRNWLMGVIVATAIVAILALVFWLLAPDSLRQSVGFAAASPTPLQIAPGTPERQKLASGNELVVVSGRVINPSSEDQQVPPIQAQLHDKSGKLLYSWTIAPPARSLPPGGSASFNSAEMGVPASGSDSTVTLTLKS